MRDERVRKPGPVLFWDRRHEVLFNLFRRRLAGQAQTAGEPHHVGVDHHAFRNAKRGAQDHIRCFARDAGQFLEKSLYAASDIQFRDKRWEGALSHFERLETVAATPQNVLAAQVGQMRCLKNLERIDAAGRASAKLVKNSKLVVYAGAPHGLTDTHKEKLNQDLLAFLTS